MSRHPAQNWLGGQGTRRLTSRSCNQASARGTAGTRCPWAGLQAGRWLQHPRRCPDTRHRPCLPRTLRPQQGQCSAPPTHSCCQHTLQTCGISPSLSSGGSKQQAETVQWLATCGRGEVSACVHCCCGARCDPGLPQHQRSLTVAIALCCRACLGCGGASGACGAAGCQTWLVGLVVEGPCVQSSSRGMSAEQGWEAVGQRAG